MNSPKIVTGVILVDHGSRRAASNDLLLRVVEMFAATTEYPIVEPAHMELAEPSLQQAFDKCVSRGAQRVIVFPYFLSPGRHWKEDIPRLVEEAASQHPGIESLVTAPLGMHPLMMQVINQRIEHCLQHASGAAAQCDVCATSEGCVLKSE